MLFYKGKYYLWATRYMLDPVCASKWVLLKWDVLVPPIGCLKAPETKYVRIFFFECIMAAFLSR